MEIIFETYEDSVFKRNDEAPFIGMFEYINNPVIAQQHDDILFKNTLVLDFNKKETELLKSHGYITFKQARKILKDSNFPYQSKTSWKSELIASAISKTGETMILDRINDKEYHVLVNKIDDKFYIKHVWYNRNRRKGHLGYHQKYYKCGDINELETCILSIK